MRPLVLNEDHFSSLVLMKTKSSIEDLYACTAYILNAMGFQLFQQEVAGTHQATLKFRASRLLFGSCKACN